MCLCGDSSLLISNDPPGPTNLDGHRSVLDGLTLDPYTVLGLARAVYASPSLVVLDEPSSNLDAEGDVALANCLIGLKKRGVTVVLISHRPASIVAADKLLLLKDGAVELFGPRLDVLARLAPRPVNRPAPVMAPIPVQARSA